MQKVNATPDSTWDDAKDLASAGADKLKELTDKAKGADWDKNYIESQVDVHQKVLDKLQDAAKSTTDTTVAAGLAKATAKVQEHLTKAQSIKAGLEVGSCAPVRSNVTVGDRSNVKRGRSQSASPPFSFRLVQIVGRSA